MNAYTLYRCHDLHFLVYGAMFLGDRRTALDAAARLRDAIPESLLRVQSPPMADLLEAFFPIGVHVMIRFGMWEELIAEQLPDDYELYAVTTAFVHYGRGVAYSATGRIAEAERERELFGAAVARVPEGRTLFNNSAADLLAIASQMLDGELLYRRGEYDVAFEALRRSIELDDNLPYDEPWGWMQPTRHAYGALLLEQGRVEEASAVYRADLGLDDSLPRALRHPRNVWSLHGYHECLTRLGRDDEAAAIRAELDAAQALTDVPVVSSCACRAVS
jgi:tetratricopeptide (TPR) repeat protein